MEPRVKRVIGYYSIFLGSAIIVTWLMILSQQKTGEGRIEMLFHLTSEALLAALCILSGLRIIIRKKSSLLIMAHSMNVYSVLNAAGFYGQTNGLFSTIPFILLALISATIIALLIKGAQFSVFRAQK